LASRPSKALLTSDQQLVLFHGYFDQYQYFPSFITCADNDQTVVLSLRPGAVHAALGADDDLEHLVRRLRQVWPGVHIHVHPARYSAREKTLRLSRFSCSAVDVR
jgi:hypothetical protein